MTKPRSAFPIRRMSLLAVLLLITLRLIPNEVLCRCQRLIQRSAWKARSRKFALMEFSEDEMRRPTPCTQYPWGLQMSDGL